MAVTSYAGTLRYLYGLQYRGMKFGLRNIRSLLADAGNPERAFASIHIAGTNGKGSTAAFLASILREAGCRTGLYTSPHLVRFTERIRIDGREMAERRLVEYVRILRPAIERTKATFFEATTCVAFLYFADEGVDAAVIETGLGGRLDATNVVTPLLSIITNVSLDHTDYLGTTIRAIAREKGGIIKAGVPVLTATLDPAVVDVLHRIAEQRGTRLFRSLDLTRMTAARDGRRVRFEGRGFKVPLCVPGLPGEYQHENAALAVSAVQILRRSQRLLRTYPGLTAPAVLRGLARVRVHTGLQGRFQMIRDGARYLVDVAHNPAGIRTLAAEVLRMKHGPRIAVFGVMKDKDYREMLQVLAGIVETIVAVAPSLRRALPARALYREAEKRGITVVFGGSVDRGLAVARRLAGRSPILVTGSHFVAGEALRGIRGETA